MSETLLVTPVPAQDPEIGRWLWAMEEVRRRYQVTPEWAVFHLVEHEAGHAFQISSLKARAARSGVSRGASV